VGGDVFFCVFWNPCISKTIRSQNVPSKKIIVNSKTYSTKYPAHFLWKSGPCQSLSGKKTGCRSRKTLQLCHRAQNNRTRGLASTGRFKGHNFSFRYWSRGRQRRPQRRPGEEGKGSPDLRSCALCSSSLPATFFSLTPFLFLPRFLYFARSLLQERRLFTFSLDQLVRKRNDAGRHPEQSAQKRR